MKRRIAWSVACLMAAFSVVAVLRPAYAAVGCRVTYVVTSQWSGGFGASVTVANLGDALNGWTLTFAFPDPGQKVVQGWNGTWAQSGAAVSVTSASWNGGVAAGGSVSLGFNGSFASANPAPAAFSVNETACTGATPTCTSTRSPAPIGGTRRPTAYRATGRDF